MGKVKFKLGLAKIQAISKLAAPHSRRELVRFLGMCGFYHRFVPCFDAMTAPLADLLQKSVKLTWIDSC